MLRLSLAMDLIGRSTRAYVLFTAIMIIISVIYIFKMVLNLLKTRINLHISSMIEEHYYLNGTTEKSPTKMKKKNNRLDEKRYHIFIVSVVKCIGINHFQRNKIPIIRRIT